MAKEKLVVFASGSVTGGGSGFENLVRSSRGLTQTRLDADIVGVVSNHEKGGVRQRADRLKVPFIHFPGPWTDDAYQRVMRSTGARYAACSGWLKLVKGLDPRFTFNIHPALLTVRNYDGSARYGGKGYWGHHVHEKVKVDLERGAISCSGVTMHFVTLKYDEGPIFFERRVWFSREVVEIMTAGDIGEWVNDVEHEFQPMITNLVVTGAISWDGKDPRSLVVPPGYEYLPK